MLKIISFTIMLFLFAAGSYAQPQFHESYERLSQHDKKIVNTVLDNFLQNHIVFLGEISQVNKLIGAKAISDIEVATGEKLAESHYELDAKSHEKEHLPVIILPAEKGPDGTYHTPVKLLADKPYSYKILHIVEIHGNYITINSSKLSDKHDSRIEIAPDQRLIKNIAEDLKGEVSNNRIMLP
jgi:hypothetical protein